jgi:hypothetical protein
MQWDSLKTLVKDLNKVGREDIRNYIDYIDDKEFKK